MKRIILSLLLFFVSYGINFAAAENSGRLAILLDPGHTPQQQGALGVRGIYEVVYNDYFALKLAKALRLASFKVHLTRQPDESVSLMDRVAIANNGQYALFLSLHHDSAQPAYLKKINLENGSAYKTIKPIAGYSIFVSKTNPQFDGSYRFAEMLGKSLSNLGRPPALHHAEAIAGENRELLNKQLGIYRYDTLAVLSKTQIPAVLLEVGVIVDDADEHYVSNEKNQDALCVAIVHAIQSYAENNLQP